MSSFYGFTVNDLIKQGRLTETDLENLRDWLRKEPNLPKFSDETLALFFLACENHFENTKKCATSNYQIKRDAPELFDNRCVTRDDVQLQLSTLNFCVMPVRTDEGYVIVLHRLIDPDASKYHMDVAMKVLFMALETSLYDNPPTGIITVFDMNGVGLKHLTRLKFWAIKKFFRYVQEGLPLKLRAVHAFNTVWFFDKIYKIIKPLIHPEVHQHLHFHTSDLDMNTFYEKWLPKKCLPSDYGGDLDSVTELQKQLVAKLADLNDYFVKEQLERNF